MSKVKLLQTAAKAIGDFLARADSATTAKASARIGSNIASRGVGAVVNSAKNNPVTAALLLFEMGDAGAALLDELALSDPRAAEVVEVLRQGEPDEAEPEAVASMAELADEFQNISDAVGFSGSMPRFLSLRRAFSMPEATIIAYVEAKELGGNLR